MTALRSKLSELGCALASVNATLSALRGVARAAWQLGQIGVEDYHRIAGVMNVRGSRLPAGRALTPGEIGGLLDTCADDDTPAGARDAAVIALLYGAGLRRSEAAALDDWLRVGGTEDGPLLCSVRKGGKVELPPRGDHTGVLPPGGPNA